MRLAAGALVAAAGACGTCPARDSACTLQLETITVLIVDAQGDPVRHLVTTTIYAPTGSVIRESRLQNESGFYTVLDDTYDVSMLLDMDEHPFTFHADGYSGNIAGAASADYVIRAGECVCHVEKISGPERLVIQ